MKDIKDMTKEEFELYPRFELKKLECIAKNPIHFGCATRLYRLPNDVVIEIRKFSGRDGWTSIETKEWSYNLNHDLSLSSVKFSIAEKELLRMWNNGYFIEDLIHNIRYTAQGIKRIENRIERHKDDRSFDYTKEYLVDVPLTRERAKLKELYAQAVNDNVELPEAINIEGEGKV